MPIFHQNASPCALGSHAGQDPQIEHFALGISTCWYLKTLAHPTRSPFYPTQPPINLTRPQREQVEYSSRWAREGWVHIGHVDFMLFVSISFVSIPFALGSQRESSFWWNMGLKAIFHWKWGSRWVAKVNEIYTKKKKCTWQRKKFAFGTQCNLYSTDSHWGFCVR